MLGKVFLKKVMVMGLLIALLVPSYAAMGMESNEVKSLRESKKCSAKTIGKLTLLGSIGGPIGVFISNLIFNTKCKHKTEDLWMPTRD